MFAMRLLNRTKPIQRARLISNYPMLRDAKPANTIPTVGESVPPKAASSNPSVMGRRLVTPRDFDKKIFVWMKYYKSVDEVPEKVSYEALDKAQNWFRIRCANFMMAMTLLGTLFAILYGKRRAESGESLHQMNVNWHDEINTKFQTNLTTAEADKKQ